MDLLELMKTRRSIRKYKIDPVDDISIEFVLEAARWAPSWKNTQCWRFIVVRDDATKNRLADALIVDPSLGETNPSDRAMRTAPVVIIACAEVGASGYCEGEQATDKGELWYMFDVALAMQNLMLAAHSIGLATVPVGLADAARAAGVLEIPEGSCVVLMAPLGYPDQEPKPRPRKELAEIVYYNRYGEKKGIG